MVWLLGGRRPPYFLCGGLLTSVASGVEMRLLGVKIISGFDWKT